jgi:RNA polymerase sigma-70 factor, ECF subfamily
MSGELQIRAALETASSLLEGRETRFTMSEDAFRIFYERTARSLLAYLLRVAGRREIAEDVLQESYCRLLSTKLPMLDEGQKKNYLFKIATNLLRDRWRRSAESTAEADLEAASPASNAEDQTAVRLAFDRLKPRERQLLWLAYIEGANHNEIAHCTGLKPGSVRLLLFRARRRLAGLIRGDHCNEPKAGI